MDILIKTLQLLLSLSILVITHEGGHFFFAKLFKTRVEKFYLFFDPWFSLFKFQKGETEYGIGWLPLGGYVKIAGMVDESMDTEQLSQPMQPWEFRAKPAWQRLLIMLGGVLVNAIEAPLIFWLMLYTWGEAYIPMSEAQYGFDFPAPMQEIGFRDGDRIIGVNGENADTYKDVANHIIYDNTCNVNVIRDGNPMQISIPKNFAYKLISSKSGSLMTMRTPVVIEKVINGSPAETAGLANGDSICFVAGIQYPSFTRFVEALNNAKDSTLTMHVVRTDGRKDTLNVAVGPDGKIGIYMCAPQRWFSYKTRTFGLAEALPAGVAKGWDILSNYVRQLKFVFSKEGAQSLGGFGTIGNLFPSMWDWQTFWFNTAFLAIILAFMNILPIPALDGGHVMFLFYEMATGRKPSDKFLERAQMIGMALLLALLVWANGNDIIRAITD